MVIFEQESLDTTDTDSDLMISIIESIAELKMNLVVKILNGGSNSVPYKALQNYITENVMDTYMIKRAI